MQDEILIQKIRVLSDALKSLNESGQTMEIRILSEKLVELCMQL